MPDAGAVAPFAEGAAYPVELQPGPGGDLYYVDIANGLVRRISYVAGNQPPVAVAAADPTEGPAPLAVQLDASGSSDSDGDQLAYAWDLDGDGQFDDSFSATPTRTYGSGDHTARAVAPISSVRTCPPRQKRTLAAQKSHFAPRSS